MGTNVAIMISHWPLGLRRSWAHIDFAWEVLFALVDVGVSLDRAARS